MADSSVCGDRQLWLARANNRPFPEIENFFFSNTREIHTDAFDNLVKSRIRIIEFVKLPANHTLIPPSPGPWPRFETNLIAPPLSNLELRRIISLAIYISETSEGMD